MTPDIKYTPTDIDGLVTPEFEGVPPQYNTDMSYTRVGNVVTISGSITLGNDRQQQVSALKPLEAK